MRTGINRLRSGIGDFASALMGGGTAMRAEQDETKRLAEVALMNAKRRNEALEGSLLNTQVGANAGLGDAVAGLLGAAGRTDIPAAAMTTFLQAGGGNANQLGQGFTGIGDFVTRQLGARQFADPTTRVQGVGNIAAGKATPADLYETSGGVTTQRFTGDTTASARPVGGVDATKQVVPLSAQTMKLFMRPALTAKGDAARNPITGEPEVQVDQEMLRQFMAWALQNKVTDLNQGALQYAALLGGGGPTALPAPGGAPGVVQAAPAGGGVIDFNDLQ